MKAVILCGGQGLRIKGNFDEVPKPLIEIQGRPILSFVLDTYVAAGVRSFILLVGNGEQFFTEFADKYKNSDISVLVLNTGIDTPTGGRIKKAEDLLSNQDSFYLTYGDGISDLNLNDLLRAHNASGTQVTLTAVKPFLPFGLLSISDSGVVDSFLEKPKMSSYTSGGFFVLNNSIFDFLSHDSDFETEILPLLSRLGLLGAFCHDGFWKSMDTYKDYLELSNLNLSHGHDAL